MHVLYVHKNFPAQFGHVADYLADQHGFRCTFVSERSNAHEQNVERIPYRIRGGATAKTHYCSRTFENAVWHTHAIYEALEARPDIRPDLIVGHSGFGTTLFLRELYDCPILNYFEYFYRPEGADMDFRPDFPSSDLTRLRARARNAMLLLDLENCDAGYSPTRWQRDRLPQLFHPKVQTIFDGVDTKLWKPTVDGPRKVGERIIPDDVKIVTYVSRGFESMRGFDIFMKAARRLCNLRNDVIFVAVGVDRVFYGGDEEVTGDRSFKQWVIDQDDYDLSRFIFPGRLAAGDLAALFSISDLHVYLTVPFVLSWSIMNALACEATVLASDTAPVREMIEHEHNGLLVDFFDVDALVKSAGAVLDDPRQYKPLGAAGRAMIDEKYSLDVCLPQMLKCYQDVVSAGTSGH